MLGRAGEGTWAHLCWIVWRALSCESRVKRGSDKSGTQKCRDGVGLCQESMVAEWDPDGERQGELAASRGADGGHGRLWHNDGECIAVVMQ